MRKCYFLLISLVIWLIFLTISFNYIYTSNNHTYEKYYEHNITFVSPNEAYMNIINNGYINKFNKTDMKVRNCNHIEDCKNLYKKNIISFTEKEKNTLKKLVQEANIKLQKFNSFYNIPWKFSKVTNKIDNGLPHTHNDTIYLADRYFEKSSLDTIIHEKIHIYQKMYPEKTDILYKKYNYEKIERENNKNRRANPDLNDFDYKHNGKLIHSEYTENPSHLGDIKLVNSNKNSSINEHPDEYFAYTITHKILNGFNREDDRLIDYLTI